MEKNKIKKELKKYLYEVLKISLNIDDEELSLNLPNIIKLKYHLYNINILGQDYIGVFCYKKDPVKEELLEHLKMISHKTGKKTILILDFISSYSRKKFIENKIQFIVPFKQMYLPDLMIDLREKFDSIKISTNYLSPVSQFLIIVNLLRKNINNMSASELCKILPYSKMSLSRAFLEIESNKIADIKTEGLLKKIIFKKSGLELWNEVLPLMKSPVLKLINVDHIENIKQVKISGIDALSKYSNISEEKKKVYALSYKSNKEINNIIDESNFNVELWKYDPNFLSEEDFVDPLSLYLTLKDSEDERVQSSLKEMIKGIKWLED